MGIFDFLTPKADGLAYDPMRLPVGADPENDPVLNYDDLGRKIYTSRFDGTQYLFEMAPPKTQSVIKGAYREATANPLGFTGDLLSNAVQSAWDAISVPARSMAGEPITYGDIAGLTGMMTLGAGAGTAPAGALRMGAAREGRPPVTFADAERAMQGAQPFPAAKNPAQVNDITDIRTLLDQGEKVFVRWSAGPKYDLKPNAKSKDYVSGETHEGLSAVELTPDMSDGEIFAMVRDYSFLRGEKADAPYFYAGRVVGRDSDGTPSIAPTKLLGSGSSRLMSFVDDDANLERISLLGQERYALAALNDPNYGKGPYLPGWKPEDLTRIQGRLSEIGRDFPNSPPTQQ